MRILKSILLAILFTTFGIGSMYALQMVLNGDQIKILVTAAFFIAIILLVLSLVQILRKKKTSSEFIKTKFDVFLFVLSILLITTAWGYTSIYNISMYEAFGNDMTMSEKLENRKILKHYIKGRKKYNNDLSSYLKGLNKETRDHVTIYSLKDMDASYVETIKESIPLADELIERIYGKIEKDPVKVIFYNKEDWKKIDFINGELVQGFFDGENIYLRGYLEEQPLWHMEESYIHEYGHYAMDMYCYQNDISNSFPAWFKEGVAEYSAVYKKDRTYSLDYLRYPIDLRELNSDEEFWAAIDEAIESGTFYDPYMYSYYMIDSLVDLKGEEVISNLILKSDEMDFYQAFEEEAGVGIEEYQEVNLAEYVKMKIDK